MASTETSFELVVRHHLQAAKEARVHQLYLRLLQKAIPHQTTYTTLSNLAREVRISIPTIKRYLRLIAAAKPWLSFRPAGRAGIAIFYRPEQTKPRKRIKKSRPPSPPNKVYNKNPINDPKGHTDKCMPTHPKKTSTPRKTRLPRGTITTRQAWERRHWMKLWRRKSYKDPSLKWAARNGVDLVRIIGHFTWHAKVEFSTVKTAVTRWWHEFLYAGKALPARGKALFQCLFVRLNAWIHKLTKKNLNKARPPSHLLPQAPQKNIPQPASV
jgi:hypothetical protein